MAPETVTAIWVKGPAAAVARSTLKPVSFEELSVQERYLARGGRRRRKGARGRRDGEGGGRARGAGVGGIARGVGGADAVVVGRRGGEARIRVARGAGDGDGDLGERPRGGARPFDLEAGLVEELSVQERAIWLAEAAAAARALGAAGTEREVVALTVPV